MKISANKLSAKFKELEVESNKRRNRKSAFTARTTCRTYGRMRSEEGREGGSAGKGDN